MLECQKHQPHASTRPTHSTRRVRLEQDSSDEEVSPTSVVPLVHGTVNSRSQRASKTAALTKMTATKATTIDEDHEEEDSEVTSEDTSDESDDYS
ncbi:Condensin complex subunit 3 like [Quillaja saponaria]|uniref:Condensin complex subunit 3 like n=1 Tax=Quillaja saponaria TaxID=32244 RepID=A0AAD7LWM6_QUISA|nr:Condensin complex subunit 3 like [Quillaja saponaria]